MSAPRKPSIGFTLVEVVLALAIVVFALLTSVALLPLGVKMNQISNEETRAANMLTALESDLRNTHPALSSGKSKIFGLPLPYDVSSSNWMEFNRALLGNTVYSVVLNEDEVPHPFSASSHYRYQVSIVYTVAPADMPAGSLSPLQARLIVNWPATGSTDVAQLTRFSNVGGFIESYITFPPP